MRSDCIVSETECMDKVSTFIAKYAHDLNNYRQELLMMIMTFAENRLLPPHKIPNYMQYFDEIQNKTKRANAPKRRKVEK